MQIITFHTKYNDISYDASTDEVLARACASQLRKKYDDGWYYPPTEPREFSAENQAVLDLTDDQLAVLPESIRKDMTDKRYKLRVAKIRRQARYDSELEEWNNLLKVVTSKTLEEAASHIITHRNGKTVSLALWVCNGRADGEYEGFDIENLAEPTWPEG